MTTADDTDMTVEEEGAATAVTTTATAVAPQQQHTSHAHGKLNTCATEACVMSDKVRECVMCVAWSCEREGPTPGYFVLVC